MCCVWVLSHTNGDHLRSNYIFLVGHWTIPWVTVTHRSLDSSAVVVEKGEMTGMSQHSNIDDMWQHRLERVGVQRFVMAKIEDQSGQTLPLSILSGEGTALLERTRGRGSTTTSRHCQLSRNNNYLKLCASWNQESPISNHYWWQKLARYYTRGHDRILGWSKQQRWSFPDLTVQWRSCPGDKLAKTLSLHLSTLPPASLSHRK